MRMGQNWKNPNSGGGVMSPPAQLPRRLAAGFVLVALLALGLALLVPWRNHRQRQREHAFDDIIWEAAARHRVPPLLIKAVVCQESGFDPAAVGGKDEIGLMQITLPVVHDWARFSGRQMPLYGLLFNPRLNIEIGAWYLGRARKRWERYIHREALALAQYNAGPVHAAKWAPADPRENVLPRITFPSTRDYIRKVFAHRRRFEQELADR